MQAPIGDVDLDRGIVQLTCDRDRDTGGVGLARALNAQFAVEAAVRRRLALTATLALMSVPATLTLVFPGLLAPALRRTDVAAWSVTVLALAANLVGEVHAARTARRLRRQLASRGVRPGGGVR
jgi:hypothetical protein